MDIIKVNKTALAGFNQIINLSNELQQEQKKMQLGLIRQKSECNGGWS